MGMVGKLASVLKLGKRASDEKERWTTASR